MSTPVTHKSKEVSLFVDLTLLFWIIFNKSTFVAFMHRVAFSTERCKNIWLKFQNWQKFVTRRLHEWIKLGHKITTFTLQIEVMGKKSKNLRLEWIKWVIKLPPRPSKLKSWWDKKKRSIDFKLEPRVIDSFLLPLVAQADAMMMDASSFMVLWNTVVVDCLVFAKSL